MQKNTGKPSHWIKLDNAANIYPAARSRNWTALFRLSAELTEAVDPIILKEAQRITLTRFPGFSYRLRAGMFWHYFEHIDDMPEIQKDVANPCVRMNLNENGGFMFRVRYHEKRIAVEIFHVVTDGTGGLSFLATLVAEYLKLKYGICIPSTDIIMDVAEPPEQSELEDSFMRYSRAASASRKEDAAYRIRGTAAEPHFLNIVTGLMPTDIVSKRAKEHGGSITELLTAVLILSIRQIQQQEMSKKRRNQPIKICVPVNLRRFYPTNTKRNFASFINPGIQPAYGEYTLDETIQAVRHFMGLEGTEKKLNARMSTNVMSMLNPVIRLVPLVLKRQALRIAFKLNGDRTSSSTLSNLGPQNFPEPMNNYVTRMDLMLGSLKYNPVTCACVSYNNLLTVNFTRTIQESSVERNFFTQLVKLDIPVEIESNRKS